MDFIDQFRIASTVLGPWEYDEGKFTRSDLDEFALKTRKLWWRREVVEGIDLSLISDLTADDMKQFEESKKQFLKDIDSKTLAKDQQILSARDAFLKIHKIVGRVFDHWKTQVAVRKLSEIIHKKEYGGYFVGFHAMFESDWSGDPAIYIWLLVEDETINDANFRNQYEYLNRYIQEQLQEKGIEKRLIYVHLRTVTEQEELLNGDYE